MHRGIVIALQDSLQLFGYVFADPTHMIDEALSLLEDVWVSHVFQDEILAVKDELRIVSVDDLSDLRRIGELLEEFYHVGSNICAVDCLWNLADFISNEVENSLEKVSRVILASSG